jgi:hypothetical protein
MPAVKPAVKVAGIVIIDVNLIRNRAASTVRLAVTPQTRRKETPQTVIKEAALWDPVTTM